MRWEYREDRHSFWRWARAKSPSSNCAYLFHPDGFLIQMNSTDLKGKEIRIEYIVSQPKLELTRLGWRWFMAQTLKMLRYKLRVHKRKT